MRFHLACLPLLFASTLGSLGCSGLACTTELRGYTITIDRDVATSVDPEGSVVAACVGGNCKSFTVGQGKFGSEAGFETIGGELMKTGDGKARLRAKFSVAERSGTTPLSVRVTSSAGAVLMDAAGEVEWDSDGCHSAPDRLAL